MLEICPPSPAEPRLGLRAEPRAHAQFPANQPGSLAAIHVLLLAWLAHLLTLADLRQAALSLAPGAITHLCFDIADADPQAQPLPATIPSRELLALLRILYVIGPGPRRGMRALPRRIPIPRHTPPIRPPPARRPRTTSSTATPSRRQPPLEAAAGPRPACPKKEISPARHAA